MSNAGIEEKAGRRGVDPVRVVLDQLEVEGVPRGFEEYVFAGVADGGVELAAGVLRAASLFEASRVGGGRLDLTAAAAGASDRDTVPAGATATGDVAAVGVGVPADTLAPVPLDGGAVVTIFVSECPFGGASWDCLDLLCGL